MKKITLIIAIGCLSILAGAGTTNAQVTDAVKVDVPFDFYIGNSNLPAGQYTVKPFGASPEGMLAISNDEGKILSVFLVGSAQLPVTPHNAELVFEHVADRYFLYEVFNQENPYGALLQKTHIERNLEHEAVVTGGANYVTVAALNGASR